MFQVSYKKDKQVALIEADIRNLPKSIKVKDVIKEVSSVVTVDMIDVADARLLDQNLELAPLLNCMRRLPRH